MFVSPTNVRLSPGSPCIDTGDNAAVPAGITTDLDGNPRFVDDGCAEDTGLGVPPLVDLGTFEFRGSSCDIAGSEGVGIQDFLAVLAAWGECYDCDIVWCLADFDGDCYVGINDFQLLLMNWGP
jgi:hypothetical protein